MKVSASFLSSKDIPKDLTLLNNTDVDYIHVDIMDGKFVPNKVVCLNDGRIVVAFGENNKFGIKIFKFDDKKELILEKEFVEHNKHITCLYTLEDGKIVTTSLDGTAVFYNPFEMKVVCKVVENKKKNFSSVIQLEDRSVILSCGKGFIYILQ